MFGEKYAQEAINKQKDARKKEVTSAVAAAEKRLALNEKISAAIPTGPMQKMLDNPFKKNNAATTALNTINDKVKPAKKNEGAADKKDSDNYLHWDANGYMLESDITEILMNKVQPKLKHSYIATFPEKLNVLDWLIKSMDRPKIDIENIEQIRNNVKRQYPIKYNFGDLSLTFWDDTGNKTINSIHNYFTGQVWDHDKIKSRGSFLLRDSILLTEFSIYDLGTGTQPTLQYTFKNAVLQSYDFDGSADEEEGVHTVQVVFKIEGYSVKDVPDTKKLLEEKIGEMLSQADTMHAS